MSVFTNKRIFLLLFLVLLIGALFRLYKLVSVPVALHGDELGIGYNAYSLLLTGKDEYGKLLPSDYNKLYKNFMIGTKEYADLICVKPNISLYLVQ